MDIIPNENNLEARVGETKSKNTIFLTLFSFSYFYVPVYLDYAGYVLSIWFKQN
jgi:hypothetical protein